MIMPAFVLGNAIAAVLMRHTRSSMLQVLAADYVRTARAKGLSESTVVLKHALRNALTPIITLGALELGTLLSGAVLTEQVFTIPGFGKLIIDAVFNRDYAVVQGVVLVTATAYIAEPAGRHGVFPGQSRGCGTETPPAGHCPRPSRGNPADLTRRGTAMPSGVPWPGRAVAPCLAQAGAATGAMLGLVVVLLLSCWRFSRRGSRRTTRSPPAGARSARRPAPSTGSAPTRSAATCCRA
jgi:hypothetical protein